MSKLKILLRGGWSKETTRRKRGVVLIFSSESKEDSTVVDIVSKRDKFYIHKQFEIKNGLLFMRLKKRSLDPVHA